MLIETVLKLPGITQEMRDFLTRKMEKDLTDIGALLFDSQSLDFLINDERVKDWRLITQNFPPSHLASDVYALMRSDEPYLYQETGHHFLTMLSILFDQPLKRYSFENREDITTIVQGLIPRYPILNQKQAIIFSLSDVFFFFTSEQSQALLGRILSFTHSKGSSLTAVAALRMVSQRDGFLKQYVSEEAATDYKTLQETDYLSRQFCRAYYRLIDRLPELAEYEEKILGFRVPRFTSSIPELFNVPQEGQKLLASGFPIYQTQDHLVQINNMERIKIRSPDSRISIFSKKDYRVIHGIEVHRSRLSRIRMNTSMNYLVYFFLNSDEVTIYELSTGIVSKFYFSKAVVDDYSEIFITDSGVVYFWNHKTSRTQVWKKRDEYYEFYKSFETRAPEKCIGELLIIEEKLTERLIYDQEGTVFYQGEPASDYLHDQILYYIERRSNAFCSMKFPYETRKIMTLPRDCHRILAVFSSGSKAKALFIGACRVVTVEFDHEGHSMTDIALEKFGRPLIDLTNRSLLLWDYTQSVLFDDSGVVIKKFHFIGREAKWFDKNFTYLQ